MSDAAKMQLMLTLRRNGVTNEAVLQAMIDTPRETFVDPAFETRAWEDIPLPILSGQTISQPSVVALMTQALEPDPRLNVLEIGTGSGYQTMILSRLFRRVFSIERHAPLERIASSRFGSLGLLNVMNRVSDGSLGWKEHAPFDRIIVTAAAEDPPNTLMNQLKIGGIMVLPVGQSDSVQQLIKVEKSISGYQYTELMSVRFVPLLEGVAGIEADNKKT